MFAHNIWNVLTLVRGDTQWMLLFISLYPKMLESWKRANPVDVECCPRKAAHGAPDL